MVSPNISSTSVNRTHRSSQSNPTSKPLQTLNIADTFHLLLNNIRDIVLLVKFGGKRKKLVHQCAINVNAVNLE